MVSKMDFNKVVGKDLIPLGLRNVTRMSITRERYLIYLPEGLNSVWRTIHDRRIRVYVYVEIPDDLENKGRQVPKSEVQD